MINIYVDNHSAETQRMMDSIKRTSFGKEFNVILNYEIGKNNVEDLDGKICAYDTFNITNESFDNIDEMDVFDLFIELINNKKCVHIQNYTNFCNSEMIQQVVEDLDFSAYIINRDFEIDLKKPNVNFYSTILEIFNKNLYLKYQGYTKVCGNFIFDGKTLCDKNNSNIAIECNNIEDLLKFTISNSEVISHDVDNKEYLFSSFLPRNNNIMNIDRDGVETFKVSVFNIIKDIKIDEIENFDLSIQTLLAENEYMPLGEIKKII